MENAKGKCIVNAVDEKPEGRVLVLYTGGTIGMMRNEQGGKYRRNSLEKSSSRVAFGIGDL